MFAAAVFTFGAVSSASNSDARSFAGRLIDCEEDRTLRAALVGMLREARSRGIQLPPCPSVE
jgi:hypothetical protein